MTANSCRNGVSGVRRSRQYGRRGAESRSREGGRERGRDGGNGRRRMRKKKKGGRDAGPTCESHYSESSSNTFLRKRSPSPSSLFPSRLLLSNLPERLAAAVVEIKTVEKRSKARACRRGWQKGLLSECGCSSARRRWDPVRTCVMRCGCPGGTFWSSFSPCSPEPYDSFPSFLFPFSKGAHFL